MLRMLSLFTLALMGVANLGTANASQQIPPVPPQVPEGIKKVPKNFGIVDSAPSAKVDESRGTEVAAKRRKRYPPRPAVTGVRG